MYEINRTVETSKNIVEKKLILKSSFLAMAGKTKRVKQIKKNDIWFIIGTERCFNIFFIFIILTQNAKDLNKENVFAIIQVLS